MTLRNFTLGTAVALTMLATGPVKAADLDPALEDPVQEIPSLPMSNVVFGSGWYVRGDAAVTNAFKVGVARVSRYGVESTIGETGSPTYDLSLGAGYAFTGHLRADLSADFFQPWQSITNNQECAQILSRTTCQLVGRFSHYDALANAYYDLGTWWVATPYVGAGAGVGVGNVRVTLNGDRTPEGAYIGYHNFAFAGMAGVAFDVYPHVKIDVGYRYLNNGRVAGTEIANHEFRAGLRYMIDN